MVREAIFAALAAGVLVGGARAETRCPAPPPLSPAPAAPGEGALSWAKRAAALKAQRAWSAPRTAYGACRRAEIQQMGARANALGQQANALIEEWNALDKKVRAARAARVTVLRAYAERRGRTFEAAPVEDTAAPGPPCSAPPGPEGPPAAPDIANADAKEMARAEEAFQNWVAPREDYLACRKVEGAALVSAFSAAKTQYEAARKDYAAYRAAFNASVAAFEAALDSYTRKLRARRMP